ncbi:hypothetical protein K1X76_08175 [bacterium]|nr:hypothetical protein [bacterium]
MMFQSKIRLMALFFLFLGLAHCGSGSSLTSEEQAQEDLEAAILPVTEEVFNIVAQANGLEDATSAPTAIKALGKTVDTTNLNCNFTESGGSGMDLAQNGLAGTFGIAGRSGSFVTLTTDSYCGKGGEYTAFSLNGATKLSFSCSGIKATDIVLGNGVFKTTADQTEYWGTFGLRVSSGSVRTMNIHIIFGATAATSSWQFKYVDTGVTWVSNNLGSYSCQGNSTEEAPEPTGSMSNLYLFHSDDAFTADFGGRTAADFICRVTHDQSLSDLNCINGVRAFLSVDTDDQISNMPDNYGVETDLPILDAANSDAAIADTWTAMLAEPIEFSDPIIDTALTVDWWSGSSVVGDVTDGFTCDEWTSTDSMMSTATGKADVRDFEWINDSEGFCDDSAYIMCLCY